MLYTFECAFTTSHSHFCTDAVTLPCGHYVCEACLISFQDLVEFSCKHCERIYTYSSIQNKRSHKQPISETLLNELLAKIAIKYNESLTKLKENELSANNRMEFIFDEIDVRVESLKMELDNLRDEIKAELTVKQNGLMKDLPEVYKTSEYDLAKLNDVLENKTKATAKLLKEYQQKIRQLEESADSLNVSYAFNNNSLDSSVIGALTGISFKERIESKTYEGFELNSNTLSVCALPNDTLLVVQEYKLKIYDKNFKMIKSIENRNTVPIENVVTNGKDKIFLQSLASIVACDLDLNFLDEYFGEEFRFKDIEYHDGHVYTTNGYKNELLRLTDEFQLKEEIKINHIANSIRIHKNIACIITDEPAVEFYNIESGTFKLVYKYKRSSMTRNDNIIVYDGRFYFPQWGTRRKQRIRCYSEDNKTVENITIKKPIRHDMLQAIEFNGRMVNRFLANSFLSAISDSDEDSDDEYDSFGDDDDDDNSDDENDGSDDDSDDNDNDSDDSDDNDDDCDESDSSTGHSDEDNSNDSFSNIMFLCPFAKRQKCI